MAAKEGETEDIDNVDFANYKGIYAEEESDTKYTCPVTGAHFEFNDVCKRLAKIQAGRKRMEEQELLKQQQKQAIKQKEVFSSSTMSVSDEIAIKNNFHSSNLKAGQSGNTNHAQAIYTRQQQQQQQQQHYQVQHQQQKQQQWMRDSSQQQQQQQPHASNLKTLQEQASSKPIKAHQQTNLAPNLKHKKAQSNQVQHVPTNQGVPVVIALSKGSIRPPTAGHIAQTSQTAVKHKAQNTSGKGVPESVDRFALEGFVATGDAGQPVVQQNQQLPWYIVRGQPHKSGSSQQLVGGRQQSNGHQYAQQQHQHQQPEAQNMDSLEKDSIQPSTSKQLSRANNQQIQNQQTMSSGQSQAAPHAQQKAMRSQFLQRNLTEVGPPGQSNVKKNNFFTEPDEAMVQQSSLLQHNKLYGLQHNEMTDQQPLQASQMSRPDMHPSHMQHYVQQSYGSLSIDQQQNMAGAGPMFNVVINNGGNSMDMVTQQHHDHQLAQHYSSNPVKKTTKDSAKSASKTSSNQNQGVSHHHQRTVASHFATQDNRQPQAFQVNQKSTSQLSAGMAPYVVASTSSKTAQGKARKSTSLKTGSSQSNNPIHHNLNSVADQLQQEQLWQQLNAAQQQQLAPSQQQPIIQHGNQYHNMEQYNSLMAQLMKNQQKSNSVVAPVSLSTAHKKSSNRTRTKSNATTSSIHGVSSKDVVKTNQSKGSVQKTTGQSQFTTNGNQGGSMQGQTYHGTDSSQYYSNGFQGPHTKIQQPSKPINSSSRNREGSSVSIGNRKNSSSQQKATLSNYIRQSHGGKQIKSSIASRNTQGIGGHLNSQVSKHGHRSAASGGHQFATMNNYQSAKHHGTKSSNLIHSNTNAPSTNPTHKIIDEVVLRLNQQQNNSQSSNLAMQPQMSGSRNQKNLMVSHTTGGPGNINKSSKHKSSGYFDPAAFHDIMQKYQRSNRPQGSSHQSGKIGSAQQPSEIGVHGAKQYVSNSSVSQVHGTTSTISKNQLSAKKQVRLSQYVHKEQKSRNPNSHGVGTSKTINHKKGATLSTSKWHPPM